MDSNTLLAYQPDYYKTSDVMRQINTANASELTILNNRVDKEYNNLYSDTADADTLSRFEKDNGLTILPNYNLDYRRARLYSRMIGKNDFSVDIIKNIASLYRSINTFVDLDLPNFKFTINLNFNTGMPENLNNFEDIIEEIKPAYLEADYKLTSTTSDIFKIRAFMLCGEEINVFPYQITNIESTGKIDVALGITQGAETITILPKGES
ncbi:putative phage tail protein [Clostridium sp.]|uniref:putative phage tail protein n=1 Tax=Clostridium sp. TaxID=1506 RepID=UPI002601A8F3|nr:putative phage tail protein [Clostridium sp.]